MSRDIISARSPNPRSTPARLTDPVGTLAHSLSPPPLPPTSFPPAQLAMCRISECAKMKRERGGERQRKRGRVTEGGRSFGMDGGGGIERSRCGRGRREEELYISLVHVRALACVSSVRSFRSLARSVGRSFRFGYGYVRAPRMDISGEPPGRSHFQFNLLKARQKVIRYFTGAR